MCRICCRSNLKVRAVEAAMAPPELTHDLALEIQEGRHCHGHGARSSLGDQLAMLGRLP